MWRLLCLLDECMQQYHSAIFNDEQDTTDPSFRDLTANLPNTAAQCATQRHPNGPAKLKKLYILSNDLPVRATEILEPFTDRLTPGWQFIESSWNSLHVLVPTFRTKIGTKGQAARCASPPLARRASTRCSHAKHEPSPERLQSSAAAANQPTAVRLPKRLRFSLCFSLRGGSLNSRAALPPKMLCLAFSVRKGRSWIALGRSKSQCG